jgi:hypothetical protein
MGGGRSDGGAGKVGWVAGANTNTTTSTTSSSNNNNTRQWMGFSVRDQNWRCVCVAPS